MTYLPQYEPFVLKKYEHFTLFLHDDQYYLGRAYAWLSRPGEMQRFSQLTPQELNELKRIAEEYEKVLGNLWQPDHMNYAWLGNMFREHKGHGHMHFIPRYKSPRTYLGITFVDEQWGKNYPIKPDLKLPEEKLFAIRDAIRAEFSKQFLHTQ
ncbi:MAG: hypothetical protein HYT93_04650 [Parcubacteria group bacterium]|nr:hypothetical protein [Parcubacteria group bacterium]